MSGILLSDAGHYEYYVVERLDLISFLLRSEFFPGMCGLVGWVLSHEPKGQWFNSWSGHVPGCGLSPQWRGMQIYVALPLPSSFSLNN